ncbi:MAG: NH(3)-dependent NAD(+) synthetase [Fimbriimonadaceae bacterium]|nr:NH(3)-dependent NAD(+) synthetase [Fimbriimonadaceae bacterium]
MPIPIYRIEPIRQAPPAPRINPRLVADWLVKFLVDECTRRRGIEKVVIGLSGGVDSAVAAALSARAFGGGNVLAIRMPYRISSPTSLTDAQAIVNQYGLKCETIDITAMVDGYLCELETPPNPTRIGNICARCRTAILFDQSAAISGLPIGTGNKTERFFGYFTWHADDAPPINPLGDLLKTQVWDLARELGIPEHIVAKPPTADLVAGQTDEGDFGITYQEADAVLYFVAKGYTREQCLSLGYEPRVVDIVWKRVAGTHWKRRLPTVAMLTDSSINEYYLRPVDY